MPERPSIPAEIQRQILVESGHRCAVCGAGCPLERAHIIPWHRSKEHKAEDLICLCASCHERADQEGWGEKTLREYKQRPWVMRNYEKLISFSELTTEVELTINIELSQFDEQQKRLLQYALAAFLNISPNDVRIVSVKKSNSVTATLQLPTKAAQKLLTAYKAKDSELLLYLAPFGLIKLRKKVNKRGSNVLFGITFTDWLRGAARRTFVPLSALSMLPVAQNIISYLNPNLFFLFSVERSKFVSYCLHIGVILFILVRRPTRVASLPVSNQFVQGEPEPQQLSESNIMASCGFPPSDTQMWLDAKRAANYALKLFRHCWMFLWLSFLLLYLLLASRYLLVNNRLGQNLEPLVIIAANLFGNCANVALIFCYSILESPVLSENPTKPPEPNWFRWSAIVLVLTVIEIFLADFMIGVLWPEQFKVQVEGVRTFLNYFLGIAGAVVLALFVGRLNSKFIDAPIWVIALLYVYAAIQPLYPVIISGQEQDKISGAVFTNAALVLKVILFLFVTWLLESGRLLFYFVRVRRLNMQVDWDWQEFSTKLIR
jgi:hypothetical protein